MVLSRPDNLIPIFTSIIAFMLGLFLLSLPLTLTTAIVGLIIIALCLMISPLTALVFMLVLSPLRNLIITEAPAGILPIDIGLLTVTILIGMFGLHRIASGERIVNFHWSPLYIPVSVFTIVASLTLFSAISPGAWLSDWLKWIVILILITLCLEFQHWEWLVFALVLAGLGHALVGIYTFLGGSGAIHLLINDRFFRAFGTFGQPNPFGGFMGLLAPIALGATLGSFVRIYHRWRHHQPLRVVHVLMMIFYGGSAGLISLAVILSWSRGAWLAFGVSIIVLILAIPRKFSHSLSILFVIVLVGIFIQTTGLLPASIEERISSATQEIFAFDDVRAVDITPSNYAVVERLAHWQAALNMADANPWLGIGIGNYEVAYADYRLISWAEPLGHAHNYYLNVLSEAGIIGIIAYLTLWVGVFLITWRTRRHPDGYARFINIGLLGTWTYLSIHSLTDQLYVNNMFLHIGVMLGILAILYNQTWSVLNFPETTQPYENI